MQRLPVILFTLVLTTACGSETDEATSAMGPSSGAGGNTSSTATVGGGGSGGCAPIEGCNEVVELCEGGQCDCQCADAPECPADAPSSNPPLACARRSELCSFATGCCQCEVSSSCGPEPVWHCIQPQAETPCPSEPPEPLTPCRGALLCTYCTGGVPTVRTCAAGNWTEPTFGCAG